MIGVVIQIQIGTVASSETMHCFIGSAMQVFVPSLNIFVKH
jgi:hypothetical protein